jgi:hypothetical protein
LDIHNGDEEHLADNMGVGDVDLAPDFASLDDGDSATTACETSHSDASALG